MVNLGFKLNTHVTTNSVQFQIQFLRQDFILHFYYPWCVGKFPNIATACRHIYFKWCGYLLAKPIIVLPWRDFFFIFQSSDHLKLSFAQLIIKLEVICDHFVNLIEQKLLVRFSFCKWCWIRLFDQMQLKTNHVNPTIITKVMI